MGLQNRSFDCGCFVKVYVCPVHLEQAKVELRGLTGQLELRILGGPEGDRVSEESDGKCQVE